MSKKTIILSSGAEISGATPVNVPGVLAIGINGLRPETFEIERPVDWAIESFMIGTNEQLTRGVRISATELGPKHLHDGRCEMLQVGVPYNMRIVRVGKGAGPFVCRITGESPE